MKKVLTELMNPLRRPKAAAEEGDVEEEHEAAQKRRPSPQTTSIQSKMYKENTAGLHKPPARLATKARSKSPVCGYAAAYTLPKGGQHQSRAKNSSPQPAQHSHARNLFNRLLSNTSRTNDSHDASPKYSPRKQTDPQPSKAGRKSPGTTRKVKQCAGEGSKKKHLNEELWEAAASGDIATLNGLVSRYSLRVHAA